LGCSGGAGAIIERASLCFFICSGSAPLSGAVLRQSLRRRFVSPRCLCVNPPSAGSFPLRTYRRTRPSRGSRLRAISSLRMLAHPLAGRLAYKRASRLARRLATSTRIAHACLRIGFRPGVRVGPRRFASRLAGWLTGRQAGMRFRAQFGLL
jgi:hypothetical protein